MLAQRLQKQRVLSIRPAFPLLRDCVRLAHLQSNSNSKGNLNEAQCSIARLRTCRSLAKSCGILRGDIPSHKKKNVTGRLAAQAAGGQWAPGMAHIRPKAAVAADAALGRVTDTISKKRPKWVTTKRFFAGCDTFWRASGCMLQLIGCC